MRYNLNAKKTGMFHKRIANIQIKVLLIIWFSFIPGSVFAVKIPELNLNEAIQKGVIKAIITGASNDSVSHLSSSYYGNCLRINLLNISKTSFLLRIEAGRLLETTDTSEQRMMVTQEELIVLQPGARKTLRLYAMCTQMRDHSPNEQSLLVPDRMADGNLLTLARFISKNKFQGLAAQEAIWVLTDNNDIGSIYSDNLNEMNQLQSIVSKLTGKLPPPVPNSIFYTSGTVSGEIYFENKKKETYSFELMNEDGKSIIMFFENKTIDKPVKTTLTWRFHYKGFPKGVYYVKLINTQDEVVVSRPVVIN